ncbi:MAG: aldehyde-activating protein [SAR86 cluster bacterium]|uniref:Aldehyde-activating protein n=1 Tax=SAR86 cluster bacterium TaxID=2030880 RepID=A0A2A5CFQ8_9GAMM|nr:MAG: aldehyde-activating protein [SAR86 cluster bacterium]
MYIGKCLCGEVNINVTGAITDIIHCHCSLCRKSSGTAYATNGFVNNSDFKITSGVEKLSTFEYKPGRNRYFCSNCGSPVYSSNEKDPGRIRIRLGIVDSDIDERPISHNFVSSKANWENLDAKLPRYESFEPSRK